MTVRAGNYILEGMQLQSYTAEKEIIFTRGRLLKQKCAIYILSAITTMFLSCDTPARTTVSVGV